MNEINSQATLDLAVQLINTGKLEEAEGVLAGISVDDSSYPSALSFLGVIAYQRGNCQFAIELMDRVIAAKPGDLMAWVTRGEAYRTLGDLSNAEASFRQALRLEPGRYDAMVNLSLALWTAGRYDESADLFTELLARDPFMFLANFYLGQYAFDNEEPALARSHALRALEANPKDARARVLLGNIFRAEGKTPQALEQFEQALQSETQKLNQGFLAAKAAFELGHEARAFALIGRELNGDATHLLEDWNRGNFRGLLNWRGDEAGSSVRVAKGQRHTNRAASCLPTDAQEFLSIDYHTPEIQVASLRDCRLLPEDHLIHLAEESAVFIYDVMTRPVHRPFISPHIAHCSDDGRLLLRFPRAAIKIATPSAYLGTAPSYCDWLIECLTRLWAYYQRPAWEVLPLVVPTSLTRWQTELLELLGYNRAKQVVIAENTVADFSDLSVATISANFGWVAPFAIEHLRRCLGKSLPLSSPSISSPPPRRLFLSRQGMSARRLVNFEELVPELEKAGFTLVAAENLPTREVLQMIRSAEIIVGVEGAAMANVFFAPIQAHLALITANSGRANRYSIASRAIGQDFTYLQGEAAFETNPNLADCDIRLDARVLRDYLSRL
ncbi:MAG: tetratricopeptide repeat protein [Burkholderiales bacterium]